LKYECAVLALADAGLRIDAGERFVISNVEIDTVRNTAQPGSKLCGPDILEGFHKDAVMHHLYMGGDASGITIGASRNINFESTTVRHVLSTNGNAYVRCAVPAHCEGLASAEAQGRIPA
jgi:hypothetical protein